MKRKVNRVGTGTLTISLPRKWIELKEIKAGDELEIVEEGDHLVLSQKKINNTIKQLTFDVRPLQKYSLAVVRKILATCYRNGYDEIELIFDGEEVIPEINKEKVNWLGFEIISQKNGSCVIKNIASPLKESFPDLIKKAFEITIAFSEDMLDAFRKNDLKRLSSIKQQEIAQNRICFAGLRILLNYKHEVTKNPEYMLYIIQQLETLGDVLKYICELYEHKRIVWDKDIEQVYNDYLSLLKKITEFYFNFKIDDSVQFIRKREYCKDWLSNIETCKKDKRMLVSGLFGCIVILQEIKRAIFYSNFAEEIESKIEKI